MNKRDNSSKDVIFIDSIMFLVQTMQVRVQFTHMLKLIDFCYQMSKIMEQTVTQIHYVFEPDKNYITEADDLLASTNSPAKAVED